jgi:hypothetical protein
MHLRRATGTLPALTCALASVPLKALALALTCALALAGCGEGTKTVSISSAPAPAPASSGATATSTTASTAAPSSSAGSTGGTSASATRTASAPAFTHPTGSQSTAAAAAATVHSHGYTANDTSQYHPDQTLGVLVGTRNGSGDGYGQQAFFFVNGRYIGTDSAQPSAKLRVVAQSDTRVTLAYPLYGSHDALCCPSGGEAKVTFQLDNGRLVPMQPIPPSMRAAGPSRY